MNTQEKDFHEILVRIMETADMEFTKLKRLSQLGEFRVNKDEQWNDPDNRSANYIMGGTYTSPGDATTMFFIMTSTADPFGNVVVSSVFCPGLSVELRATYRFDTNPESVVAGPFYYYDLHDKVYFATEGLGVVAAFYDEVAGRFHVIRAATNVRNFPAWVSKEFLS